MHIRKAVITAAGRGARLYPAADTVHKTMIPLVDRDGVSKPILQILAGEALESGIEEVCLVCAPGDEEKYRTLFAALQANLAAMRNGQDWARVQQERLENLLERLHFRVQHEPLGYGHAVYCARDFVQDEPFLLLLSDHLYVSLDPVKRCAEQLLELASQQECSVASVQATREHRVGNYGVVSGKRVQNMPGVYQIERVLEKPSISTAELELQTPGLRAGFYLCFFGMQALTPAIFEFLEARGAATGASRDVQLTPALQELAEREKYLALEVEGRRYDIDARFGLLEAQLALSLAGKDRDVVLSTIAETLAEARLTEGRA